MIGAPALAGWLLAGLVGLAVGLAAGAFAGVRVPHDQPWQVRSLLGAAAIGLVIAGIISVASGPAAVSLGYARQRPASEPWAAAVIILVFAAMLPPRHRHPNANQPDAGGPTGPTET